MEDGLSLIMVDEIDWETLLGPQFIIGFDREPIPVYIGHYLNENNYVDTENRVIGIWVKTTDYHKINHDSFYIFIHDYDISEKEINEIMDWIEEHNDESLTVDESDQMARSHYHIGVHIDEQLGCFENQYLH